MKLIFAVLYVYMMGFTRCYKTAVFTFYNLIEADHYSRLRSVLLAIATSCVFYWCTCANELQYLHYRNSNVSLPRIEKNKR